SSAWLWLTEQWHRLLDWLETLRVASPARYYLLLAAMTLVLLAILAHLTWVVWRSLRPRDAVGVATPDAAPPQGPAWHLAEARRRHRWRQHPRAGGAVGRLVRSRQRSRRSSSLDLPGRSLRSERPGPGGAAPGRDRRAAPSAVLRHRDGQRPWTA